MSIESEFLAYQGCSLNASCINFGVCFSIADNRTRSVTFELTLGICVSFVELLPPIAYGMKTEG